MALTSDKGHAYRARKMCDGAGKTWLPAEGNEEKASCLVMSTMLLSLSLLRSKAKTTDRKKGNQWDLRGQSASFWHRFGALQGQARRLGAY